MPKTMLANVRSLAKPGKFDEVQLYIATHNIDLCVITETWLNEKHSDSHFSLPNYSLLRCDRMFRIGRGVAALVKDCLHAVKINPAYNCPEEIECLFFKTRISNIKILNVCIYCPNVSSSCEKEVINFLLNSIDYEMCKLPDMKIQILGDFNKLKVGPLLNALNLKNCVLKDTRENRHTNVINILDKILLSKSIVHLFDETIIDAPIWNSDHNTVLLFPKKRLIDQTYCAKMLDLSPNGIQIFIDYLVSNGFSNLYVANLDVNKKADIFDKILNEALSRIPVITVRSSLCDKPWMKPWLKNLITERWTAYRAKNYCLYNILKTKVKNGISKCISDWKNSLASSNAGPWKFINKYGFSKQKSDLQSAIKNFNSVQDAANAINAEFGSVFTQQTDMQLPIQQRIDKKIVTDNDIWNPLSEPYQIYYLLRNLNCKKSCGSDDITNRLYKEAAFILAEPVCHLINSSIIDASVPVLFKLADVAAVPKTSPPKLDQLRGISLLSTVSKILETIVYSSIKPLLLLYVPSTQHAYKAESSCTTALILLNDHVARLMDNHDNSGVGMLSFDFSKAFDKLDHHTLIQKLCAEKNTPVHFIKWVSSYLSDRKQRVRINGVKSDFLICSSGVPQGSIIGPLLFIFYTSSYLPESVNVHEISFSDDTTLVIPLKKDTTHNISCIVSELNHMKHWASENSLVLNLSKTKLILFCKKGENAKYSTAIRESHLSSDLDIVNEIKLLGVWHTDDHNWSLHFVKSAKKASKNLYPLRKLKKIISHSELCDVVKMSICSIFEYSAPLFVKLNYACKKSIKKSY